MIEQILTGGNLLQAMHQVQKNHGSAGVDRMPVTKLSELMAIDREALVESIRSGKYLPQPILGVDHCLLLELLYRRIKCRETMRLIRKWLRAPMCINGKLCKRRKGMPQGSPISPLLSNILLNELDRELERHELRFVRYADDFSIYAKTEAEA